MRMRTLLIAALVPLALGFATAPAARDKMISLLRSIEALPDPARLDEASGEESAAAELRDLADDDQVNPHARWQAISELAHYPGPATDARLRQLIDRGRSVRTGPPTLYARAAALALAQSAKGHAVGSIVPLLDHPVPDVRADAARALALTGSPDALPALRARRQMETSVMVRSEIAEAIAAITP